LAGQSFLAGANFQIMPRDIDRIIESLKREFPAVQVTQLQVTHPADDDGLWFINVPGKSRKIQIESPDGNCPFLIEFDGSTKQLHGKTVDDVLAKFRILHTQQ
jgi:hypothetical protein